MTEPGGPEQEPPQRPISHRAPFEGSSLLGRVLAPVAAVAVVVVVIVLLLVINGHGSGHTTSAANRPSPSLTPTASATKVPTAVASTPPPTSPATTPAGTASASRTKRTRRATAAAPAPMAPVQVLNNSRRTGLAHHVAAEMQGRGWPIAAVGNLQGRLAATTVYYAPGDHAAATHLAAEFPSIQRIAPDSEGRIHTSGLTLVLTRDWSG